MRSRQIIDRLEPFVDGAQSSRRFFGRQGALQPQPIDRARAFDGNEFAGHKSVAGSQLVESPRLTQDDEIPLDEVPS